MSVLGDKIAANILAQTAKVPSIPWSGSYGGPNDGPLEAELNDEGTIPEDIFEKVRGGDERTALGARRRSSAKRQYLVNDSSTVPREYYFARRCRCH